MVSRTCNFFHNIFFSLNRQYYYCSSWVAVQVVYLPFIMLYISSSPHLFPCPAAFDLSSFPSYHALEPSKRIMQHNFLVTIVLLLGTLLLTGAGILVKDTSKLLSLSICIVLCSVLGLKPNLNRNKFLRPKLVVELLNYMQYIFLTCGVEIHIFLEVHSGKQFNHFLCNLSK